MSTDNKLAEVEQAIRESSSDILKNVLEIMADPEGGIGIDQIEVLIGGHLFPVISNLLDAAHTQRDALAQSLREVITERDNALKLAIEPFNQGFELAHELAKCGHARANYRDSNYKSKDAECDSSRCEFCEADKTWKLKVDAAHADALRAAANLIEELSKHYGKSTWGDAKKAILALTR